MNIIESNNYKKEVKKVLKNRTKELTRLENIKNLIISKNTMHDVIIDPFKEIYHIEKKEGNLKEFYTARINGKIRLFMKPVGDYPYDLKNITDIVFEDIDDEHYGEG